jgi:hypothetical protein
MLRSVFSKKESDMRASTTAVVFVGWFMMYTMAPAQGLFESAGIIGEGPAKSFSLNGYIKGTVCGGENSKNQTIVSAAYAQLSLKLDAQKSGLGRAFAEVRFNAGRISDSSLTAFDLREAWGAVSPGLFDIKLGRQIIAWGRADGINPTNNITPKDETVFSGEFDDTRLGNELLSVTAKIGSAGIQGIWIPYFRPDVLPLAGAEIPSGITIENAVYPDSRLDNGGFAFRLEFILPSVDGSLSYFNGYPTLPGFDYSLSQTGLALIPCAYRMHAAGADFSTNIGPFGLRGEAALKYPFDDHEKHVYVPNPFAHYVLGLDRTFDNWNMLMQYSGLYVMDYAELAEPVLSDPFNPMAQALYASELASMKIEELNRLFIGANDRSSHAITGNVQWNGFHETVHLKLAGMYNFTTKEYAVNPGVVCDIADAVSIEAGGRYLSGPDSSLNDMVSNLMSFAYAQIKVSF